MKERLVVAGAFFWLGLCVFASFANFLGRGGLGVKVMGGRTAACLGRE